MNPSPYDRLPNESLKAWNGFVMYRDMGIGRSIAKVKERLGLASDRHIQRWSAEFAWVERVAQYEADRGQEALHRKLTEDKAAYLKKLGRFNELNQEIGTAGVEFVSNYLKIAAHLMNPLAQKIEAGKELSTEETSLFWQLRRCKDVLPIADLCSGFLAESLHLKPLIEQLEGEKGYRHKAGQSTLPLMECD